MSRPTATSFDKPPCLTLDTVTLTWGGGGGQKKDIRFGKYCTVLCWGDTGAVVKVDAVN